MTAEQLKLYLVTDRDLCLGRKLEDVVAKAVAGGVTMVQLREKDAPTGEFIALGRRLKALLSPLGVPLIINDRVDVALAVDADGVHIGQSDMPYELARRLMGPDKIIGLSVESMADLEAANAIADLDYVGISPVYATPTKEDTAEPFGLEGLRKAVALSTHPTVAIGGMNCDTIGDVMATGCDGVAVVSAICSAPSPSKASEELLHIANKHYRKSQPGDTNTHQHYQKSQPGDTKTINNRSWTREAWERSLPIYERICAHPFISELAAGTLAEEKFMRYLAQDEIYIKNYGEEMFLLADMMPTAEAQEMFRNFAKSGMEAEGAMHQMLIDRFHINTAVEPSSVTTEYMNHTRKAINSGSVELAMAAMLPCMWIYNEVGLYIYRHRNPSPNPYSDWVDTYRSDEFTEGVEMMLKLFDQIAEGASEELREEMMQTYLTAAEAEWRFWDWGYNGK